MSFPVAALELENKAIGPKGAPTLGAAYALLREEWSSGSRDRELLLHLMFLAWYSIVEPPHLTGFENAAVSKDDFDAILRCVLDTFLANPAESGDTEMLFVVGLMAQVASWVFGDEVTWDARIRLYRTRYRELAPDGIDPKLFAGRGAYGDYFGSWATRGGF